LGYILVNAAVKMWLSGLRSISDLALVEPSISTWMDHRYATLALFYITTTLEL